MFTKSCVNDTGKSMHFFWSSDIIFLKRNSEFYNDLLTQTATSSDLRNNHMFWCVIEEKLILYRRCKLFHNTEK